MWADWTFLFLSFSSCVLTNYSAAHASFPCCLCCPIRLTSRSAPKLYTPSYPPASSQPGLAPTALSPDSQGMRGLSLPTRPARQWPPGTHPDPGWLGAGGEETDSPSSSEGLVEWRWVRCLRPPNPRGSSPGCPRKLRTNLPQPSREVPLQVGPQVAHGQALGGMASWVILVLGLLGTREEWGLRLVRVLVLALQLISQMTLGK